MKKVYYIGLLLVTLLFASCDLDKYPYSEVAVDEYVKDASSVNNLVLGCYSSLHNVMYYEWAMTELRSDNGRMYATGSTASSTKLIEQLDQGTIVAEHQWVEDYWNSCYVTIARVNNVISYLDVIEDETLRNQYEGEALFLRSLEYFNLVRLWGPVFIVTSKVPSDVARNMQRSTVEEVYALIEGDLEKIITNEMLPEQMADADKGRADRNAAKALLAKVYATHYKSGEERYARAAQLCKEVLESTAVGNPQSGADLVPYAKIFDITNEMNKEIIFAARYLSGSMGLGSPFGNLFAPVNNGANVILGTSSGYNTPSDNLIAAYELRGTDDQRLNVNIAQQYYNSTTKEWVESRYCKKYTNPVTTQYDGESDWPIIRVGDIALLYAELTNEISGPSADNLKYLNMISERAGVPTYTLADLSNRYDFREAVRNERRLELAFENQRWFDMLRWGTATQTVNNYLKSEPFYSEYIYTVNDLADWQTYLPIPVSVVNINPDIAQNTGY